MADGRHGGFGYGQQQRLRAISRASSWNFPTDSAGGLIMPHETALRSLLLVALVGPRSDALALPLRGRALGGGTILAPRDGCGSSRARCRTTTVHRIVHRSRAISGVVRDAGAVAEATDSWEDHAQWLSRSTALRDDACELAREAADSAEPAERPLLCKAQRHREALLTTMKSASPELYAVAKHSTKRNGDLGEYRGSERCLIELELLSTTYAALAPGSERDDFLSAVRPIARAAPTSERLRWLLVVCRGYHSPGYGSAHGWRRGQHTVHQFLASGVPPPAHAALEPRLAAASEEVRRHSRSVRAAFAVLDPALRLWLANLDPAEQPEGSETAALGTASLLLWLVDVGGAAGAKLATALARWAADSLLEAMDAGTLPVGSRGAPSGTVAARAHGSEGALLLLASHAPLVRGSRRQQRRWLEAVDRVGHGVWLMVAAAHEVRQDGLTGGRLTGEAAAAEAAGAARGGGAARAVAAADATAALLLQRVRAVMLCCSLLERSDSLRPKYRAAMARAHTPPAWLWRLLSRALLVEMAPDRAQPTDGDAGGAAADTDVAAAAAAADADDDDDVADHDASAVAAAMTRLVSWSDPQLLFKYMEMHADDRPIASLASRWVLALLGLSTESLAELRCDAPPNAAHFRALAASSPDGARAVRLWIDADRRDCAPDGAGASDRSGIGGICDAQSLFMMGEELRTCMRVDRQCVRENAALLSYLTQVPSLSALAHLGTPICWLTVVHICVPRTGARTCAACRAWCGQPHAHRPGTERAARGVGEVCGRGAARGGRGWSDGAWPRSLRRCVGWQPG